MISLRISVTDRCEQRCLYCMPPGGVPLRPHGDILSFEEIARFVRALRRRYSLAKAHLTGGEPLVRRGIADLIRMLHREGVEDLALTTNGQRLGDVASDLKRSGLRRVNVSLHSLDPDRHARITGGGILARTVAGIEAAQAAGLSPVKINVVALRGWNDGEAADLVEFAFRRGCEIRFIELMPIGCARNLFAETFVPSKETRRRIEERFRLRPLLSPPGQSSRRFAAESGSGLRGLVGFISSETHPFCGECNRLRLTSTGDLIACLSSGAGLNIRRFLRGDAANAADELLAAVERTLALKRRCAGFGTTRPMSAVGG